MKDETEELIRLKNAQMIITHCPLSQMSKLEYVALIKYVDTTNEISTTVKELLIKAHEIKNNQSENKIQ